jgi:glucose/arabinose dehydrogenase
VIAAALVAALAPAVAQATGGHLLLRASFPAAMAATADGGLDYGELMTGRLWHVSAKGKRDRTPLARIARIESNGLRGLLGLAVDRQGRVFADWTGTDGRIHVARVAPGARRAVWSPGADFVEANGGRLAFAHDGRLLVSVGDRDHSVTPNPAGGPPSGPAFPGFAGAIYSLDPSAGPSQTPLVLASGFFNPFGLAVTPSGDVWATDNAITPTGDLIAHVHDGVATPFAYMAHTAPSGLAAIDDRTLAVCGFVSQRLDRFVVNADGTATVSGPPIATGCQIGVVRLHGGLLAYATQHAIYTVKP